MQQRNTIFISNSQNVILIPKKYLSQGWQLNKRKSKIENNKVKAVKKQKTLIKIKEVENILKFANFYKYFIKNFSHTVKPLNELKDRAEWKCKEEH